MECVNFNPHSREGSDGEISQTGCRKNDFNPHSREGSDDRTLTPSITNNTNFNPHSREGSDITPDQNQDADAWISIHTPAKGVTCAA